MALHEYEHNGLRYQFDDDDVPTGAKRVEAKATEKKAAKPAANKARTPSNKAAKPAAKKPDPKVEAASDPGASE